MARTVLALAMLVAACSFDSRPGAGDFLCQDSDLCPRGHRCVEGRCIDQALVPDADTTPDAELVIDAAPPGDGPLDYCSEATTFPNTDDCTVSSYDLTDAARAAGGVTVYGDTRTYINDLGSPPTYCGLPVMLGADAIYRLDVQAGEHVVARVDANPDATWDTVLYLSTGCATGATCPTGGGDDRLNMTGESIDVAVSANATYFLAVDANGTAASYTGCYRLHVELVTP